MNMLDRLAIQAAYSKKGRRMIHNMIMVMIVSFALIFGAIISMLTAPADIRASVLGEKEIGVVSALPANVGYFNSIPIIDSLNIKIIGRYPWPLNGTVTCQYGWRTLYGKKDFHGGIDISTANNDPVVSIDDGTVEKVHTDKKSYGLYILIKHDDGFYTLSAHLAQAYVKEGERVKQGETIALEGGQPGVDPVPGRSTGRHLHFEIRQSADSSSQINPLAFLDQ